MKGLLYERGGHLKVVEVEVPKYSRSLSGLDTMVHSVIFLIVSMLESAKCQHQQQVYPEDFVLCFHASFAVARAPRHNIRGVNSSEIIRSITPIKTEQGRRDSQRRARLNPQTPTRHWFFKR